MLNALLFLDPLTPSDYDFFARLISFFVFWGFLAAFGVWLLSKIFLEWEPSSVFGKILRTFSRATFWPVVILALGAAFSGKTSDSDKEKEEKEEKEEKKKEEKEQ